MPPPMMAMLKGFGEGAVDGMMGRGVVWLLLLAFVGEMSSHIVQDGWLRPGPVLSRVTSSDHIRDGYAPF